MKLLEKKFKIQAPTNLLTDRIFEFLVNLGHTFPVE